jgi:hypothetical protein
MEDPHLTDGHPITDEVKVNLHMLRALVLDGVGGEVDRADVVAVDERGPAKGAMELGQELPEPGSLSHAVGNGAVLRLGTGAGGHLLALGGPGHQVASEEDGIARGGPSSVWTASPVGVSVDDQLCGGGPAVQEQAMISSASEVPEETLESSEMRLPRIMHMKAQLLNCIGDVRPSEGEVLKSTSKTAVCRRISHWRALCLGQLALCVNWSGAGLAICHPSPLKYVQSVLTLVEKKASWMRLSSDSKKVVKHTQILHRKLLLKRGDDPAKKRLTGGCQDYIIHIE